MHIDFNSDIPETNIISLSKKRIEYRGCKHHSMIIDPELDTVSCKDCKEKLNPMAVLARFAGEEKTFRAELIYKTRRLDTIAKKLDEKRRTKCHHCGSMTPVNIKMSDMEWRGFK